MPSTHLSQNEYLQEAEKFARDLFLETPNLSIDEAARQIDRECKRSLIKPVISKIRTEVRQRIEAAQKIPSQPMLRKDRAADFPRIPFQPTRVAPAPFNPPRIVQEAAKPTEEVVSPEDVMEDGFKPLFKPSTKQERSAYLSDWFMKHPTATISEGRLELQRHFGVSIATADIVETKNLVRQLQEEEKRKVVEPPPIIPGASNSYVDALLKGKQEPIIALTEISGADAIKEILNKMRAARIRKIELLSETAYSVEGAI